MSREIKFREWNKKGKCWITSGGVICRYENGTLDIVYSDNLIYEQYTDLKDKNGKEIYEGDILETCCGKTEVYFDDELLMYKIKARHGGTMPLVSKKSKRHFDYEIIGNIHENPELLGGEE